MVSVEMSDRVVRPSHAEIAAAFREAAGLLRIQGANPFRVAAYEKAADTIDKLSQNISEVAAKGIEALEDLPQIGSGLASAILELVRTGRWTQLERLRGAADPEALFRIIPGIGPGLARRIHEHLDCETLEALEVAAHEGRLAAVPGVGPRRAKAILLALSALLNRRRPITAWRTPDVRRPSVDLLLDVDREYRDKTEAGVLQRIAPRRFNPEGKAWLPILHTGRGPWHFTVLYSNSARAHELRKTGDWVVIYYATVGQTEAQCTVVTETSGPLRGRRVVRGRESETPGLPETG